jgi:hypothetical protein
MPQIGQYEIILGRVLICLKQSDIQQRRAPPHNDRVHPPLEGSEERTDCKRSGATFCCNSVKPPLATGLLGVVSEDERLLDAETLR